MKAEGLRGFLRVCKGGAWRVTSWHTLGLTVGHLPPGFL